MVELEINGKKVTAPEGSMVIQAAQKSDTYVPHFCYHKKLSIAANCRMCLVDVEKMRKPVPACATPVSEGMVVRTHSPLAVEAQQSVMEFLLINHPLDCPICDQGGECQLQDLAVGYGRSASRYQEEKRVVFHKNVGPLISMEEMSRCIHCTRCVRFGQEIAGMMEFGMLGRGEHSEITTFVGKTVDSELSGNMIDLCPVGALTSKPFRYTARTWELTRRFSVSPHDSVGANLVVQVKNNKVMRVLPKEVDDINECWISDKDRFSYEALNSDARLTTPMIKQGGQWFETDWQTALEYVVKGVKGIAAEHGKDALGFLGSAHSTLEELYLFKQLAQAIGTPWIDSRLRQSHFPEVTAQAPWLGMKLKDLSELQTALVVGANLRKEQPLMATRLRQAAKNGAQIYFLNAVQDDAFIPQASALAYGPTQWLNQLLCVAAAVATQAQVSLPEQWRAVSTSEQAQAIAQSLLSGERKAILLGNAVVAHPDAEKLHAVAQWIADQTHVRLGFLSESANTVGAYLAGALPEQSGYDALAMFAQPRKGYFLLNVEPAYDVYNPQLAAQALAQAEMVVVMSPFKQSMEYADVLLPISPFTETAGTFINAEARIQSFQGIVQPLQQTRPAWKVLRVLANLLNFEGFTYDSVPAIRQAVLGDERDFVSADRLSNRIAQTYPEQNPAQEKIERFADVPIYHADMIVRRAHALSKTVLSRQAEQVMLPSGLFARLGLKDGEKVRVKQADCTVEAAAFEERNLAENVVRLSAATALAAKMAGMFGELMVEKA